MNPALPWAIGVFEGEGSICLSSPRGRNGKPNWTRARLQVSMTDQDVVLRLHEAFGVGSVSGPHSYGTTKAGLPCKSQWAWQVTGEKAVELLTQMYPLLGERRRARALEVIRKHDEQRPVVVPVECPCGKTFRPRRATQKYCDMACRQATYYRRKHEVA